MKTSRLYRIQQIGVSTACFLLFVSLADAKPGKGSDKKGQGHSEKGKSGRNDKGKKGSGKDKKGKHNDKSHKKMKNEIAKWREKRFRDDDRARVIRYFNTFRDNDLGLPPGLAKNYHRGKPLPPGWQKKVHNGYVIEDDWKDYFFPVAHDTFPFLERVVDTQLYWYGNRIVRVYEPRREVIDVIVIPTIRFD